jgi:PAS domain S-box-containing protein
MMTPLGIPALVRSASLGRMFVVSLLVGGSMMAAVLGWAIRHQVDLELRQQAHVQAALIARTVNLAAETVPRKGALQRQVAAMGAEKNVELIVVAAGEPLRVIATTKGAWLGEFVDALPSTGLQEALLGTMATRAESSYHDASKQKLSFASPIVLSQQQLGDGQLVHGAVAVHLDISGIHAKADQINRLLFSVIVAALLGISLLIGAFIHRRVLRPLDSIRAVVSCRKLGETSARAMVLANDEIGELAATVNDAFDEIDRRAVEVEKLALIAARTHNAVILADTDGRIEWVNEGFTRLTEFTLDEVRGKKPGSVLQGPRTDPGTVQHMREALANGGGFTAEIVNYSKSGREYVLSIEVKPIRDAADVITGFMAIETDITESRRAEEALRRLNAELEQRVEARTRQVKRQAVAMDATMAGMAILEDGLFTYMNAAYSAIFGYEPGEMLGEPWRRLFDAAEQERAERDILAELSGLRAWRGEIAGRRKDGSRVELEVSLTPISPSEVIASCRDITLHKQQEEALALHTREIEDLYNNAPCGYHALDVEGRIVRINDTELCWLGYTRDELLGTPFVAIMDGGDASPFSGAGSLRGRGGSTGIECALIRKDGSRFPVLMNTSLLMSSETSSMQIRSTVFDITERKRAELAMARAARLKDEFLANMSHELRTPLNAILGMSELLQEGIIGPMNEKQAGALETIRSSGNHLLDLINDILDLSRIESGHLDLRLETAVVDEICESSLTMIKQAARARRLRVEYSSQVGSASITADVIRLKQCLINLLTNAVKFTPVGGKIGLEVSDDAAAERMSFSVWDTGIGISQEDQGRLFQPFVQIDAGLARNQEGTGLGLALTQRLVELHGGTIETVSAPGQGSRFTLSLPWKPTRAGEAPRSAGEAPRSAGEAPRSAGEAPRSAAEARASAPGIASSSVAPVILLAEDNEWNIETTGAYLRSKGYAIVVVRNGLSVLDSAREHRPDLILMDIQMPGMDGVASTRRLRAERDLKHLPIIALTALAMPGDRDRCLRAGADEYLSKPVRLKELDALIRRMLERARQSGREHTA